MESVQSFTNNQQEIILPFSFPLTKESKIKKRGRYKNFATNAEYQKWYYKNHPEKKKIDLAKRRARYLAKVGGKLKYNKSPKEHANSYLYKNWFKYYWNQFGLVSHKKDGADITQCRNKDCLDTFDTTKRYLKINHKWHKFKEEKKKEKRKWSEVYEDYQTIIVLGQLNKEGYRLGCLDNDKAFGIASKLSKRLKSRYVSNRIGSSHFFFWYKENDLGKDNEKIIIDNYEADLKMCQYMVAPLSINYKTGEKRLYRIRSKGSFNAGKFEKVSEAKKLFIQEVKQIQRERQLRKEQRLLKAQIIQQPKIVWIPNLNK